MEHNFEGLKSASLRPNGSPSYFRMDDSAKGQSQKWLTFLIKNYYPLPKNGWHS